MPDWAHSVLGERLWLACYASEDTDGCEANGGIADKSEISAQLLLVAELPQADLPRVHRWTFSQLHACRCSCIGSTRDTRVQR